VANKWYELSSSPEKQRDELEKTVRRIMAENHIDVFDAVLIDGLALRDKEGLNGFLNLGQHGARFILLWGLNSLNNFNNQMELLKDSSYVLFARNPSLRNGYAIFKKAIKDRALT
jgi:hypothetical protein